MTWKLCISDPNLGLFSIRLSRRCPLLFSSKKYLLHKSYYSNVLFKEVDSINTLFLIYQTLPQHSRRASVNKYFNKNIKNRFIFSSFNGARQKSDSQNARKYFAKRQKKHTEQRQRYIKLRLNHGLKRLWSK